MKKYELTSNFIVNVFGVKLFQIKALVSFSNVEVNELGGYIEKEGNLDQHGNAWVSGNAQVSGNAWVSGNAQVSGDARVSGNAQVYGDARVYGSAQVYGDARVYGSAQVSGNAWVYGNAWEKSPLYIQGSKYPVCMYSSTQIKIGCQIHTAKEWMRHGELIAKKDGFTPEEIEEYRMYIELAIKRYRLEV